MTIPEEEERARDERERHQRLKDIHAHVAQKLGDQTPTTTEPVLVHAVPLRAQLVNLRQRIILRIRWWFRLPIDDVRDQRMEMALELQRDLAKQLQQTIHLLYHANKRLNLYEEKIPRMRELRRQFDEAERITKKANGDGSERLAAGVLV